ncbi:MAG: nucleotidyl transferase AbiEii/AbiGii toxin family protein [Planctomycetes bacterium]|nr:nucleotidyl transferase AbiEii/AbiGii toxin family protein [Planctomycetota bacterium]
MALTAYQLDICRLIARQRIASGESYVAGGAALGAVTGSTRISRDIDLFHDTAEAVRTSWAADRQLLEEAGNSVVAVRERGSFVEAVVARGGDSVVLQWTADSAYRFFPLAQHPDFGLVLHHFDLATNKVLALVGRLEPRDWIDVIGCHQHIQRLGYLAWAACGKDPGFSPASILEHAGRSARYSDVEIASLAFEGPSPAAADLSRAWHAMLDEARGLVAALPPETSGRCVLGPDGRLFNGDAPALCAALAAGRVQFHEGRVRGALPQIRSS